MGKEMWKYLGRPGTYSEILEIVEEIKKERKS